MKASILILISELHSVTDNFFKMLSNYTIRVLKYPEYVFGYFFVVSLKILLLDIIKINIFYAKILHKKYFYDIL